MQNRDLSAVISSRICHDLVSPVGAIVNGIDLMREIGGGDMQDELGMIGQSAERAAGLLQFYRIAFGAVGEEAAPIARNTLRDQAARLIETQRITLDWDRTDGPPLQRPEARLLFLLILCGRALLGMRGSVGVQLGQGTTWPMSVTVMSDPNGAVGMNTDDLVFLGNSAGDPSPRQIEFALAREVAMDMGLSVAAQERPGTITLAVI